jgi:Ca2+-binding RTX toxin-like protein
VGVSLPAGAQEEINYCFGEQVTIEGGFRETVVGTSGPDVIRGGRVIDGGAGDDLICSLNGHDLVLGGRGDDKIDGGDNQDTIEGGPGDDYMDGGIVSSYYADVAGGETVSYEHAAGPVNVDISQGTGVGEGTDTVVGFTEIVGSEHDDVLRGSSGGRDNGDFIDGRAGDDAIYGSQGNDVNLEVLIGGEGNDSLHGFRGREMLLGGEGNDSLYGNRNGDSLRGGYGDDYMGGGIGDDSVLYGVVLIWGGEIYSGSKRAITANLGRGTASGEGKDVLSKLESVRGGEFDDLILGDGRSNSLSGGGGNDLVRGGRGRDYLRGGDYSDDNGGRDELYGGEGSDFLVEKDGSGGDVFDGNRGTDECDADPGDTLTNCEL